MKILQRQNDGIIICLDSVECSEPKICICCTSFKQKLLNVYKSVIAV